jgi:2-polyprenyl-3-methyl-5-hydroxy-6-metoxy-1,4-benzoquinol methylase
VIAGERLRADSAPDVRYRHIGRYRHAINLARHRAGTWWDVACADGYGTKLMPSRTRVGFDRDGPSIAVARARDPAARYWCADVTEPWWWLRERSRPNVVLSIETLEHLPADAQPKFIADLARLLEPHGVVVLACPIGDGPSAVNPWHLHEPSEQELRTWCEASFPLVSVTAESYESTSGPAVQAFAVCYAE